MRDIFLERLEKLMGVRMKGGISDADLEKERALKLLQIIHDLALLMYPYPAQQESAAVPLAAVNLGRIAGIAAETIKLVKQGWEK